MLEICNRNHSCLSHIYFLYHVTNLPYSLYGGVVLRDRGYFFFVAEPDACLGAVKRCDNPSVYDLPLY